MEADIKVLVDQIYCVLRRATNLQALRIGSREPDYSAMLGCLTFPRLRHLESSAKLDEMMYSFIEKHPGLQSLCLPLFPIPDSISKHYHLPHLDCYQGPGSLTQSFVPHSPVHTVALSLSIAENGMYLRSYMEALTKSTVPIVSIAIIYSYGWSMDVINMMPTYFPRLSNLTMHPGVPFDGSFAGAVSYFTVMLLLIFRNSNFVQLTDDHICRMIHVLTICPVLCPK